MYKYLLSSCCFLFFILICACQHSNPQEERKIKQVDSIKLSKKKPPIEKEVIEDNLIDIHQLGEAFFLEGTIGTIPIDCYLSSTAEKSDTLYLKGVYWYTEYYKPLEIEGFYIKNQQLWLHSNKEEFFELSGLMTSSAKGIWKKQNKELPCALNLVNSSSFDFVKGLKEIMPSIEYITINAEQVLAVDQEKAIAQKLIDEVQVLAYNNWKFVYNLEDKSLGINSTSYYQRLVADKPTILYLFNETQIGKESEEQEDGTYLQWSEYITDFHHATLYTFEHNKWQKKEVHPIVKSIQKLYGGNYVNHFWFPETSPKTIMVGDLKWIWNGEEFLQKK